MIRFWSSGTVAGADLDAEVAARDHHARRPRRGSRRARRPPRPSRSSRSRAPCEPALRRSARAARGRRPPSARTRARRSRRRARARTRGRRCPSRVSDGIGSGTPGQVHALVRADLRRRRRRVQRARPCSTSSTRSRTRPSSISTSWPGPQHVADHGGRDGQVAVAARACAPTIDDLLAAFEHDAAPASSPIAELRALEVGDQRERPAELVLHLADEPRALARDPRACRARS